MKNWKPIGVIGAIVPWNFPLMLLTWKIAPALAMGNTVVLKPASYTRLTALLLAEIAKEAGIPDGVFNVVTGNGRFGSKLASHDDVDKVAFTGSTEVGQLLRKLTAGTGKKISLELGGKSPVVVFESADLDSAVEGIVDAIWFNQGQVCSAGSRIFVQETVYDTFLKRLKERLSHWRVGDSLDKAVDMGALVDESQLTTIRKYVQTAIDEGGEVFQPDIKLPETGLFYPPTLITNVQTASTVFLEEIFGPVAVLLPFRTAKEAVSLANNTKFGLAASVWTEKTSLNLEVALLIKAGAVWINCHNMFDAAAGFGGYRQSGYGRDGGKEGLYEYAKPSWETRCRPVVTENVSEFGKPVPGLPKLPTAADSTKNPKIDRTYKLFYSGGQKRPDGQYSRPVYTKSGQMIAQVSDSNRKDVREAVEAAQKALPGWSKRAAHNRAQIIYYLAENLELRRNEFSEMLQQLTGVSEKDALLQVDKSIERLFYWSAYADKYGGTVQETLLYGATVKIHEPVGLIAISCPDEEPLLSFISLLAPAVVRGNVVVMAASDKFPIPAIDLVQVLETSDVPAGVVNVLTGNKDHITKYLAEHQNVEAMWYFGGALGSKFVEYESAVNLKRTWVNYGKERNWSNDEQGAGEEFLYHTTQVKNIWIPMGDIFAN
ncbi:DgyrCDS495 [Dimorphilus gyrociliatus]|nr:DgyrCDS495 [Dimorphilus gyrociliatus]